MDREKLAKAGDAIKAQGQQDELKRPEDIAIIGARKGDVPQKPQDGGGAKST